MCIRDSHGGHFLIARKGFLTGIGPVGDGIAHPGIPDIFDAGSDVAHHTGGQLLAGDEPVSYTHLDVYKRQGQCGRFRQYLLLLHPHRKRYGLRRHGDLK